MIIDDLRKYYKPGEILRNQHNKEFIIVKVEKEKMIIKRYYNLPKIIKKIIDKLKKLI